MYYSNTTPEQVRLDNRLTAEHHAYTEHMTAVHARYAPLLQGADNRYAAAVTAHGSTHPIARAALDRWWLTLAEMREAERGL